MSNLIECKTRTRVVDMLSEIELSVSIFEKQNKKCEIEGWENNEWINKIIYKLYRKEKQ